MFIKFRKTEELISSLQNADNEFAHQITNFDINDNVNFNSIEHSEVINIDNPVNDIDVNIEVSEPAGSAEDLTSNSVDNFSYANIFSEISKSINESTECTSQDLKLKRLYLLLFLIQSKHPEVTNEIIVAIAKAFNLILECDDIPKSYATLCKRARIFNPTVNKYLYNHCGLIGPLTPAQISSNQSVSCSKNCNCSLVPNEQMDSYFCY